MNERELDRRLTKLRKSVKSFPNDPGVEDVHQLRTRTRRVESILHSLQMDGRSNERKILRDLKAVRKRAGKVRDMDVLTADVIGLNGHADSNCLVRLVHHLGAERQRHAAKLSKTVRGYASELRSRLKKSRRRIDGALERFAQAEHKLDASNGGDSAPMHAVASALQLAEELASVRRLNRDNLHPYRIEIKRLRYLLELASDNKGDQFAGGLDQVQDAIGEWHDWVELSSIAAKVLPRHDGCSLMKAIESTAERKFDDAMRVTEQMRRRYLLPRGAASKKRNRSTPVIAPPVLAAASKIAA